MKGANGNAYIVDARTVMREGNQKGYKSTEDAIKAFDELYNRCLFGQSEDGKVIRVYDWSNLILIQEYYFS